MQARTRGQGGLGQTPASLFSGPALTKTPARNNHPKTPSAHYLISGHLRLPGSCQAMGTGVSPHFREGFPPTESDAEGCCPLIKPQGDGHHVPQDLLAVPPRENLPAFVTQALLPVRPSGARALPGLLGHSQEWLCHGRPCQPVATVSDFLTVVFSSGRLTRPFRIGPASKERTTVRKSLTVATRLARPRQVTKTNGPKPRRGGGAAGATWRPL